MSEETTDVTLPTNLVDLLDQLVLPPEPEPVSMIPQTAGWAILALLAVGAGLFALFLWRGQRQRNAYRAEALAALQTGQDAASVAAVLRRCALVAYPRDEIAALSGADWLAFLDKTEGGTAFSAGPGQVLATAPYREEGEADPGLMDAARHWVRAHKGQQT